MAQLCSFNTSRLKTELISKSDILILKVFSTQLTYSISPLMMLSLMILKDHLLKNLSRVINILIQSPRILKDHLLAFWLKKIRNVLLFSAMFLYPQDLSQLLVFLEEEDGNSLLTGSKKSGLWFLSNLTMMDSMFPLVFLLFQLLPALALSRNSTQLSLPKISSTFQSKLNLLVFLFLPESSIIFKEKLLRLLFPLLMEFVDLMSFNHTYPLYSSSQLEITVMELKTILTMESMPLSFTTKRWKNQIFQKNLLPQLLPPLPLLLSYKIKNALLIVSASMASAFLYSEVIYLLQDLD